MGSLHYEIRKHWERLKRISTLTDFELQTSYDKLLTKLTFINEQLIPENIWRTSETLVADVDIDDIDFIALTKYLKGILWTGDKPLYNGLRAKHFRSVYNTADLIKLRNKLSS